MYNERYGGVGPPAPASSAHPAIQPAPSNQ